LRVRLLLLLQDQPLPLLFPLAPQPPLARLLCRLRLQREEAVEDAGGGLTDEVGAEAEAAGTGG
jgi:hypothetical protein